MKKLSIIFSVLAVLLAVTGFMVYKSIFTSSSKPKEDVVEEEIVETLPQVDSSVVVDVKKSALKDNTVIMKVTGMASKMATVGYELTYDSQGLIKGVNSGSKPIETTNQNEFERDIYLGTCSRNVCKPDVGVTKVSIVMEFTDTNGKKSQFSKDFDL